MPFSLLARGDLVLLPLLLRVAFLTGPASYYAHLIKLESFTTQGTQLQLVSLFPTKPYLMQPCPGHDPTLVIKMESTTAAAPATPQVTVGIDFGTRACVVQVHQELCTIGSFTVATM